MKRKTPATPVVTLETKYWVMVDFETLRIWIDTVALEKQICLAKAAELLSLDGERLSDRPNLKPKFCHFKIKMDY